jgi:hypothetical protein
LARGKGEAAIFEQKSIYSDILSARLPHLITRWCEEFGGGKKKWTFEAFTEFVLREARVDEEISRYTWGPMTLESTSQSEDQI